jgi:protein-tyrosine phosphatase
MRRIDPYPLWLGHAGDARNFRAVFDARIQALVQLAMEEPALQAPRELMYCRIPLVDGAGNRVESLKLAITTVGNLLRLKVPSLVCCSGGMSRAPAVAAAALASVEGTDPGEWLRRIITDHPHDVALPLWQEVIRLLPTLRPAVGNPE